MDRQWMYGQRCTMVWINGLKTFSMLLRPTSRRKVSCCVHAAFAEIKRSSQKDILYMSTFLRRVSWITILFGPSTVNLEFRCKTMKKIIMMITSQTGFTCMKRCLWRWTDAWGRSKCCKRTTTTWRTRSGFSRCTQRSWNFEGVKEVWEDVGGSQKNVVSRLEVGA